MERLWRALLLSPSVGEGSQLVQRSDRARLPGLSHLVSERRVTFPQQIRVTGGHKSFYRELRGEKNCITFFFL